MDQTNNHTAEYLSEVIEAAWVFLCGLTTHKVTQQLSAFLEAVWNDGYVHSSFHPNMWMSESSRCNSHEVQLVINHSTGEGSISKAPAALSPALVLFGPVYLSIITVLQVS